MFPCGEGRAQQCESVILTAEDGLRDTCIPRLLASGADLSKIYFLTGTKTEGADNAAMFDLSKDIAALRAVFKANPNIRIFVIDPLQPSQQGQRQSALTGAGRSSPHRRRR